mmetsp:Transcript_52281/g.118051  ORF Transcript_52281/g.118051 Transcript_52281/m.118051 type:complete len:127 (-) Transcript_52281:160-540(-)
MDLAQATVIARHRLPNPSPLKMAALRSFALLALLAVQSAAARGGMEAEISLHSKELSSLEQRVADAVIANMTEEDMELVASGALKVRTSWGRCHEVCGHSACKGRECKCNCQSSDRDGKYVCPHTC